MRDGDEASGRDSFGDPADRIDPHAEARLDSAIGAWVQRGRVQRVRRRRLAASVLIAAVVASVAISQRPDGRALVTAAPDPATLESVEVPVRPVPVEPPTPPVVTVDPVVSDDRLAQASLTADSLAYAFQPVSDGVGDVMRLLIDAVPGTDGLTL